MTDERIPCLYCGEPAEERHHVAGRRNDPVLTADLCTSCHRQAQRELEEVGVQLDREQRTMLERLVVFLRSLGAHFLALGKRMLDCANLLAWLLGGTGGSAAEGLS